MVDITLAAFITGAALAASLLVGLSVSSRGLTSSLLIAYVTLVAQTITLVTVLSPGRHVTRGWLAVAEIGILGVAVAVWRVRGCPRAPLSAGRSAAAEILGDRVVAGFALVVGLALAYELSLVLTVQPNNWDSLTYHLPRVAEWLQHGGVHWIPDAPTDRMNEFQSLAEQTILWLFVATGSTATFALPQYVAQLALLVAIYGSSRALGYDRRSSACASFLFASLSLVALEATTAQNDLVAASFPAAATALLLAGGVPEVAVAGVAVGLGLGVKLTTLLVLPILLVLAVKLGRRRALLFAAAGVTSFVALGMWGFVLNQRNTGHWLGNGGGRVELDVSPSPRGLVLTSFRTLYRLLDLSGFGSWTVVATTFAGLVLACVLGLRVRRGGREGKEPLVQRLSPAIPLLAPALVIALAVFGRALGGLSGIGLNDPAFTGTDFRWSPVTEAGEDVSGFGPFGGLALLATALVTIVLAVRRRSLHPAFVLGLSLPVFVAILSLLTKYNAWLSRFLIVPVALTAPLLALLFRRRMLATPIVLVASLTLSLAVLRNELKPAHGRFGAPWSLSRVEALQLTWRPETGAVLIGIERLVPARACVGAILGSDEPSYVLYGPRLERRVTYVPRRPPDEERATAPLRWVVVGGADTATARARLGERGWALRRLAGDWYLATNRALAATACTGDG